MFVNNKLNHAAIANLGIGYIDVSAIIYNLSFNIFYQAANFFQRKVDCIKLELNTIYLNYFSQKLGIPLASVSSAFNLSKASFAL